jgi:hypothetical protein
VFSGESSDTPGEGNVSEFETFRNLDVTAEAETGFTNAVSPQGYEMLTVAPTQINPDGDASPYDHPEHAGRVSLMVGSFGKGNVFWTVHNGFAETVSTGYDGYGYAGYGYAGHLFEDLVSVGRGGEILSVSQETWDKPAVSVVQKAAPSVEEPEPEPEPESGVFVEDWGLYVTRDNDNANSLEVYPELAESLGVVVDGQLVNQAPTQYPVRSQVDNDGDQLTGLPPETVRSNYLGDARESDTSYPDTSYRMFYCMLRVVNTLSEEISYTMLFDTSNVGNVVPPDVIARATDYECVLSADMVSESYALPDPNYLLGSSSAFQDFEDFSYFDELAFPFDQGESAYTLEEITMTLSSGANRLIAVRHYCNTMISASGSNPIQAGDLTEYADQAVTFVEFRWWLTSNPSNVTSMKFGLKLFGDNA